MVECVLVRHVVTGSNPVHSAFGRHSGLRRTKSARSCEGGLVIRLPKRLAAGEVRRVEKVTLLVESVDAQTVLQPS
jgi:hypothetical protein